MEVSEVKHWLVGNIPGDDISRGQVIAEYIGSAPTDGSGYHRYVFIVYEQPNGPIEFNEPFSSDQDFSFRPFFHLQRFALRYNLGKPLAGNLYFATFDESVPILRAQLGIL
uniref:Uncharacterized protein n=1 Tax=Phlebotomus papatasi TaxID=29031 RepID=A0A1B0DN64_PHLPP